MKQIQIEMIESSLSMFRALRLWHWKQTVNNQYTADFHRNMGNYTRANERDKAANFHLEQVQLLNNLFEAGDSVTKDLYRMRKFQNG